MMFNLNINLTRNRAFKWYKGMNCYVCGHAFYNEVLLENESLSKIFSGIKSRECAVERMKQLNGFFSVIVFTSNSLFIAVDHVRSIPLFWKKQDNEFYIFDEINELLVSNEKLDNESLCQFETGLFVVGRKTLFLNIFQIEAGEYLWVDKNETVLQDSYYSYKYKEYFSLAETEIFVLLDTAYRNATTRLVRFLNGRKAVIPLSGGHDSRIIAYYLKSLGYKNIISYSYGKPNNEESNISKKVADFLEIPWFFIDYERNKMRKLYKSHYKEFSLYCSSGVSVPCTQEWYAIYSLTNRGIINEESVIIPGHTGDFLAGAHILEPFLSNSFCSLEKLIEEIMNKHLSVLNWKYNKSDNRKNVCKKNIYDVIGNLNDHMCSDEFIQHYEHFNWKERQAKFICNAVRAYEFYNIKWCMPLWDKELIEIWTHISPKRRFKRELYCNYVKWLYPDLMSYAPVIEDADNIIKKNNNKNHIVDLLYDIKPFHYFKVIFNMFQGHYLFRFISVFAYTYNILKFKTVDVNLFFNRDYIRYLVNSNIKHKNRKNIITN